MAQTARTFRLATFAALMLVSCVTAGRELENAAEVLRLPSMNVFRRFDADAERLFEFYGQVLGFRQLGTFGVAGTGGLTRFQIGTQELKFTRRTGNRDYADGGVRDATGLRLLTFFFPDEAELVTRFVSHGYAEPELRVLDGRRVALVDDPDGQAVELVIETGQPAEAYGRVEIGLTVSDLEASREFYRAFIGLEELPPRADTMFDTTVYGFRHGSTTINLRHFGGDLPADTGSGGIQYVVADVDSVNELALQRKVVVDQPLNNVGGSQLRTVWLDDPDGITNYFAQTGVSRAPETTTTPRQ